MVRLWRHSIYPILLMFLALSGQAQAVITLHDHNTGLNVSDQIEFLEDPTGELTLDQVRQSGEFHPSPGLRPSFGFSSSVYWVRIRIANLSNEPDWLLQVRYPPLDYVDFYTPQPGNKGGYTRHRSGDLVPPADGRRTSTYLQFPLINDARVRTYYLRIQTESSVILDLKILTPEKLATQTINEQYFQGAYFGLMCVMALYNFFVFLVIRDRSYLYYTGFITSTAVFQIALHGYAGVHFWPESIWWNNISNLFAACFSVGFCGKFAQNFIQLNKYHPTLNTLISWLAAASFCIGGTSLFINYQTIVTLIAITGFAVVVITLVAAALAWRKGSRPAGFYLVAWIVLLTFALIHILIILGIIPSYPVLENSVQIGGAVEAILLSMGLADRINTLQKDALHLANSTNQMKDEFISSITHELLTPLNSVTRSLDMLKQNIDTETEKQFLKTATNSSTHLLNLIESMFNFVELRRGNARLNSAPMDIKWILTSIYDYFDSVNDNASLHFHFAWDKQLPKQITGDERKVTSVIIELIKNAYSFTQQGHIAIAAERVDGTNPGIRISVSDSGQGIGEEKLKRIQEAIAQGDQTYLRVHGGLGIGLAMCNDILTLMHSRLDISSQPDEGTCVSFTLPIEEPLE